MCQSLERTRCTATTSGDIRLTICWSLGGPSLGEFMSGDDDTESGSQALREFARLVLRDGVDSHHLEGYVQRLLAKDLIELHASCRYEAIVVCRYFKHLDSRKVAAHLLKRARERELECSSLSATTLTSTAYIRPSTKSPCGHDKSPLSPNRYSAPLIHAKRTSWLMELIAAGITAAVGVVLLESRGGDASFRIASSGAYCTISLIYSCIAAHSIWRNMHAVGRP